MKRTILYISMIALSLPNSYASGIENKFFEAFCSGDLVSVKKILRKHSELIKKTESYVDIYLGGINPKSEILSEFIKAGFNVKKTYNEQKHNLLHTLMRTYVETNEELLKMTKLLVDHGTSLNQESVNKNRPIHFAANRADCPFVVKFMLDRGAKLDVISQNGDTPLILSVRQGNIGNIKVMLNHPEAKLCWYVQNRRGESPFQYALERAMKYHRDPKVKQNYVEIVKLFIMQDTFDINKVPPRKKIKKQHLKIMDYKNIHGENIFFSIFSRVLSDDNIALIKMIFEHGHVDIHTTNEQGDHLGHIICENSYLSKSEIGLLEYLLYRGLNYKQRNHVGKTMSQCCSKSPDYHKQVVQVIRKNKSGTLVTGYTRTFARDYSIYIPTIITSIITSFFRGF